MNTPTEITLNLLCLSLIVPFLIYALVTQLWKLPLKNGPGYFLGVEVVPGFYDGPDSHWLTRYHALLVAVHLLDFAALAAILAIRRWSWIPIWAGGTALFLTSSMMAFTFWARRRVGAPPPVLQAAISLAPRRLGDYISWPLEMLCSAVVACSWWMLRDTQPAALRTALLLTWTILGLLPGKIAVVRQGWPLPAERAAEHHRAQEAARRLSVRMMDAFGWLLASILFAGALRHAWPLARSTPAAQWLVIALPLAFAALLMVTLARQRHVLAMGRTLRPEGSWKPPFGRAAMMSRTGLIWFAVWFGGVLLLMSLAVRT